MERLRAVLWRGIRGISPPIEDYLCVLGKNDSISFLINPLSIHKKAMVRSSPPEVFGLVLGIQVVDRV